MIRKNLLISTALVMAGVGISGQVHAKAEWAAKFGVGCESCHSSGNGTEGNVKSAAKSAFKSGGLVGLRTFLGLDTAPANTKPVISAIAAEWDATVGEAFSLPLSVSDAEQDDFGIVGKLPTGATLSAEYTADNNLPTVDMQWTPTADQANKVYTVKFTAKETATTKKLASVPVTAKIRVWPAGDRDQAYVSKFIVSTTKWAANTLALKGKVVLNKLMNAVEKNEFLGSTNLTANITQGTTGAGVVIANSQPVTLDAQGNWTIDALALTAPFSCNVTVEFEGKMAARKIVGAPKDCIK